VDAWHRLSVGAEHVVHGLAHAGHDLHVDGHVGLSDSSMPMCAIGEPSGPMLKSDIHRAALHAAVERRLQRAACPPGYPVVGGASVFLVGGANGGAVFDARDVARIGTREEGVRPLGGLSFLKVPASTIGWQRRSYSSVLPSHQWMWAGLHSAAMSATQAISFAFLT
jgi:hypothetical protein